MGIPRSSRLCPRSDLFPVSISFSTPVSFSIPVPISRSFFLSGFPFHQFFALLVLLLCLAPVVPAFALAKEKGANAVPDGVSQRESPRGGIASQNFRDETLLAGGSPRGGESPVWGLSLTDVLEKIASHPLLTAAHLNQEAVAHLGFDVGKRGSDEVSLGTENVSGGLTGYSEAETTLSWRRPMLDGARVRVARKEADRACRSAAFETERLAWRLSSEAQGFFHRALGLRDLTVTADELVTLTEDVARTAYERVKAGAAPESEAIKADMELTRARTEQKRTRAELAEALLRLGRALGTTIAPESPLTGTLTVDLSLPSHDSLLVGLHERHPAFREQAIALEENRLAGDRLRAENRPEYAFEAGVRDLRADKKATFVMGVTIDLPNRNANAGARAAVETRKRRIEAEQEAIRQALETELDELLTRFSAAREAALDLRDRILPAARNVFDLALEGYRLGKTDQLTVLEARKSRLETQRELQKTVGDLYQATTEIEKICGICLVGEHHESTTSGAEQKVAGTNK
ncbi:MAG: TolC family protein [Candidatus Ozemobacteraceae bacterium]